MKISKALDSIRKQ